jgi:hypothetical protein
MFLNLRGEIMNYYKIFKNNKIISISTSFSLRHIQKNPQLIVIGTEENANWIEGLNNIRYFDNWMRPSPFTDSIEKAKVTLISEEEYKTLYTAFSKGIEEEIPLFPDIEEEVLEETEPFSVLTATIKELKIYEIRKDCSEAIKKGIILSINSQEKTFPLEITDQLNITRLYQQAINGETFLPYHSEDGLCENFSKENIVLLYQRMCEHINYHTVYHNALQEYVKSLTEDAAISSVTYGMEIPKFFQTDPLKEMK